MQAEKPRTEAIEILQKRTDEVLGIMNKMKAEFNSIEETTISLANIFNEQISILQPEAQPEEPKISTQPQPQELPKISRKKRKRGTELTLDD